MDGNTSLIAGSREGVSDKLRSKDTTTQQSSTNEHVRVHNNTTSDTQLVAMLDI